MSNMAVLPSGLFDESDKGLALPETMVRSESPRQPDPVPCPVEISAEAELRERLQSKITPNITLLDLAFLIRDEARECDGVLNDLSEIADLVVTGAYTINVAFRRKLKRYRVANEPYFTYANLLRWVEEKMQSIYQCCRVTFSVKMLYPPKTLAKILKSTLRSLLLLDDEMLSKIIAPESLVRIFSRLYEGADDKETEAIRNLLQTEREMREKIKAIQLWIVNHEGALPEKRALQQARGRKIEWKRDGQPLPPAGHRYAEQPVYYPVTRISMRTEDILMQECINPQTQRTYFSSYYAMARLFLGECRHVRYCYSEGRVEVPLKKGHREQPFILALARRVWSLLYPTVDIDGVDSTTILYVTRALMDEASDHPALKEAALAALRAIQRREVERQYRIVKDGELQPGQTPVTFLSAIVLMARVQNDIFRTIADPFRDEIFTEALKTRLLRQARNMAVRHIMSGDDQEEIAALEAWHQAHPWTAATNNTARQKHIKGYLTFRGLFKIEQVFERAQALSVTPCISVSEIMQHEVPSLRMLLQNLNHKVFNAVRDRLLRYTGFRGVEIYMRRQHEERAIPDAERILPSRFRQVLTRSTATVLFNSDVIRRVLTAVVAVRTQLEDWDLDRPLELA